MRRYIIDGRRPDTISINLNDRGLLHEGGFETRPFCNGPLSVNPYLRRPCLAGHSLLYGVSAGPQRARGCHLMVSMRMRSANLRCVVVNHWGGCGLT